jgi:sugar/nucleoside kinase (ribokinase family)
VKVGVVGQTARDVVTAGGSGSPVERLGGATVYASRALRFAGFEPVVVSKGPVLEGAVNLPSERVFVSRLELLAGGLRQAVEATGDPFTARDVEESIAPALAGCRWVLLGGQTAGDFPPETIAALAAAGHRLILDAQGQARGHEPGPVALRPFPPELLAGVQAVKLNELEARAVVGRVDERALAGLGVPEVLVTLGERGAVLLVDGVLHRVPGTGIAFADPTGAGDSWAAIYAGGRTSGLEPLAAAERATATVERLYRGGAAAITEARTSPAPLA